jgi:serine/threonine protein kinase
MPPEQILGKGLTTRADLFSVGVLLYEMLTAVKPFAGEDLSAVLHNILRMEVAGVSEVNAAVPRPVGDFVARLMAKSPDARPTAADAMQQIASLRTAALTDTLVLADTLPPSSRLLRRVRPLHAAVVIGVLVVLAAIPAAIIRTRTDSSPTVTIPQGQLDEFAAKRRALDEADAEYDAGRYQESLQRYEAYLQKYPYSIAAQEGRDAAKLAIEQQKLGQPKPATRRKSRQEEDISPSELLRRFRKKVFGR